MTDSLQHARIGILLVTLTAIGCGTGELQPWEQNNVFASEVVAFEPGEGVALARIASPTWYWDRLKVKVISQAA